MPEGDIPPDGMQQLRKGYLETEPSVQGARALLEEVTNQKMDAFQINVVGDEVQKE